MIRSRLALLLSSVVVVVLAVTGVGWVAGAVIIGWYMAIAPGSATCRLLRVPTELAVGWVTVIAASLSIDAVITEAMVYAHVWTPARGVVVIAATTTVLVLVSSLVARKRHHAAR